MARRNRHRRGDYLVKDDYSGHTIYASQAVRDYRGFITKKGTELKRNPQDFATAIAEDISLPLMNPKPDGYNYQKIEITNYLLRSEQFTLSPWTVSGINIISASRLTPRLDKTAIIAQENFTTTSKTINQINSTLSSADDYTFSLYVANPVGRFIELRVDNNTNLQFFGATFDFTSGLPTATQSNAGTGILYSSGFEDVGDGWYRLYVSGTPNIATGDLRVRIVYRNFAGWLGYMGEGLGFTIWGAQLSIGRQLFDYVRTEAQTGYGVGSGEILDGDEILVPQYVGTTMVPTPRSFITDFYAQESDLGIGQMEIGNSFIVR